MNQPSLPATRDLWKVIAGDVRRLAPELVVYELLFKLLTAAVIAPTTAALVSWMISLSGETAITNDQIASFLFSPLGIATGLVWSVLAFTIAMAEQSGLLVIAAADYRSTPMGALSAIVFGLRRISQFARLAVLEILIAAMVVLPVLTIAGAIYLLVLGDHDINYYLAERPPKFVGCVGCGIVLGCIGAAALATLHIWWLFALPRVLLEDSGARAALRASREMVRGQFWHLAKHVLIWLVASSLLGLVTVMVLRWIALAATGLAGDRVTVLLPTLGLLTTLNLLAAAAISFVSIITYSLLVTRLYQQTCQVRDIEFASHVAIEEPRSSLVRRFVTKRRFAVGAAVVLFAGAVLTAWGLLEVLNIEPNFKITAHRGSSLRAPENSLAAIDLAIREGADYIEIDVQETADGQIVVLHDKDFMRLAGVNRTIWETTYADLADVDIGSNFDPAFADQRVPLLSDVIDRTRGKAKLNIELKFNGHDEQLVQRVVDILREEDFVDECVVSSLDQNGLTQVQNIAPEIRTGLITAVSIGQLSRSPFDFLSVSASRVTPELISAAHRQDKEVHVWTVNDPDEARRLIDMGVDNLLTDDPLMLFELRQEKAELNPAERLLLRFHRWANQT